ncbi:hypothetical protein IV417_15520 [Alphaproteobacteria bacterium KMM 3653]|uniref:Uncharacterized protein n=1 Tax=Harenicola maris TaxID=2841044 RepID=A0AAP2G5C5_9RHOB|nr:hypothetical protein [Harenicola maris]
MSAKVTRIVQFYDAAHDDRAHTALPGLMERYNLAEITPRAVEGPMFSAFAMPYDEVDKAQYYRFTFHGGAALRAFLEAEVAHHDGIVLTPSVEAMSPQAMVLVTADAGLQQAFAAQSIPAFLVAGGALVDPESFGAAFARTGAVGRAHAEAFEDEVFGGAALAIDLPISAPMDEDADEF